MGDLANTRPGRAWARVVDRFGYPKMILGLAMLIWFVVFGLHVYWHHSRIGTFGFDLGIFDQSIWLASRLEGFNTVRGIEVLGHHGSIGFYLLVPFYWIGAGPNFLNLLQVGTVVSGAIPVFLASRRLLHSEWFALVPALAFLTHFSIQWMLMETFHPEVMAITPFLFAYLAAQRERWVPFALWLALAVSWKEDLALAAIMFGLILAWRGHRKVGLYTAAAAAAWLLFVTQVLIPHFSSEGAFYWQFFGDLGSNSADVVWNSIAHPNEVIRRLNEANLVGYVRDLALPYGLMAFLAPMTLLIALPQILINLLSIQPFTWDPHLHYAAVPVLAFTIAMIEGWARVKRMATRRFLIGATAALALSTAVAFGISPVSSHYRDGVWLLKENPKQAIMDAAIATPGPGDSVATTYNLVPHLTHRHQIYQFPNPWRSSNWGVRGENQHDPATVDWLVIDLPLLGPEDRITYEEILATGEWEIVSEDQSIVVVRRIP